MKLGTEHGPIMARTCSTADGYRQVFDGLFCLVLWIAPLAMGGRHPAGQALYGLLIGGMALVWFLRQQSVHRQAYRRCGLETAIAAGLLVLTMQIYGDDLTKICGRNPFARLGAGADQYLSVLNHSTAAGYRWNWTEWSVVPIATRYAMGSFLTMTVFLVLVAQRIRTAADADWGLRQLAIAGVLMATIGVAQYFWGNGKFLGLYANPYRDTHHVLRGTFYNENHFAHFLILAVVPLWHQVKRGTKVASRSFTERRSDGSMPIGWMIGLILVVVAICLTGSRGALCTLVVVAGWCALWNQRTTHRRESWSWWGGLTIGGIVIAISVSCIPLILRELGSLAGGNWEEIDAHGGRRHLWNAALQTCRHFGLFGSGAGTFREVFPLYYGEERAVDYAYAENGYLQIAAEMGWIGVGLLLYALLGALRPLVSLLREHDPNVSSGNLGLACSAGIIASLFHSCVDFVWFIPACFTLTLVTWVCLVRVGDRPPDEMSRESMIPRGLSRGELSVWGWGIGSLALFLVGYHQIRQTRACLHWENYQRQVVALDRDEQAGKSNWENVERIESLCRELRSTIRDDPHHARAYLRLAGLQLRLFELEQTRSANPMTLSQIRDAALASGFRSAAEQEAWLRRLLGPRLERLKLARRAARRALQLCPFQGQAYLYLAEVAYLVDPRPDVHRTLVSQSLAVRPHDASIRFAAGQSAIVLGNLQEGMEHWREAFRRDRDVRSEILQAVAPTLGAQGFIQAFAPDLDTILQLAEFYQAQNARDELKQAAGMAITGCLELEGHVAEGATWPERWRKAYALAADCNDPRRLELLRRIVHGEPEDYTWRRRLAMELLAVGQFGEARTHLAWCLDNNPTDQLLANKLAMLETSE